MSKKDEAVLFEVELDGRAPADRKFRIRKIDGAEDCVVEVLGVGVPWRAVDSDSTCAEVYMRAFLQAKTAYDALALGVGSLAALHGLWREKVARPAIVYTDPPKKKLSELRASDVPNGMDPDDVTED